MEFLIRKIDREDWEDLLNWRNDELTRKMFINGGLVDKEDHFSYMDKMNKIIIENNLYSYMIRTR